MGRSSVGQMGEDIACRYLERKGHHIIDRNFRMKFGEIDVVREKGTTVFISEVKTVVGSSMGESDNHRPEENVSSWKLKKLSRVVQVYLSEKYNLSHTSTMRWKFLVIAIVLDVEEKTARVRVIEDVLD